MSHPAEAQKGLGSCRRTRWRGDCQEKLLLDAVLAGVVVKGLGQSGQHPDVVTHVMQVRSIPVASS